MKYFVSFPDSWFVSFQGSFDGQMLESYEDVERVSDLSVPPRKWTVEEVRYPYKKPNDLNDQKRERKNINNAYYN